MEAAAERFLDPVPAGRRGRLLATAVPTLSPGMLLPRRPRVMPPFPFSDPSVHYLYFARNGIYSLARLWSLAGKEILFPAYFHGVELEALLEAGVRPRFYPVSERMQVDPNEVIERITKETKAIYLIHYLGFPGPVEELAAACAERGIRLIEDCALALLSCLGEKPLGSFGHASVFCIYKTLPAPNGGILALRQAPPIGLPLGEKPGLSSTLSPISSSLLQNFEMNGGGIGWALGRALRTLGRGASQWFAPNKVPTGTQSFNRAHVNLAMSEISKTIIEAQDHSKIVEKRRRSYFHLLGRLRQVAPPIFSELPPGVCPLFYPVQTERKERLLGALWSAGIEAVDFWRRGHPSVPPGTFPEVDRLRKTIVELPCHQDLEPPTIDKIADIVAEALG